MLLSWKPLGEDARARPERRRERGGVAVAVDHRDVGRPGQRREVRRAAVAREQSLDERRRRAASGVARPGGVDRSEPAGDDGAAYRRRRARDDPHPARRSPRAAAARRRGRRRCRPRGSGMSCGHGRGALVAQELEARDHRRRLRADVRAVDRRVPPRCARGSERGSRAGTAAGRSSPLPTGRARARARTARPTAAARTGACASASPATSPGTATDAGADVERPGSTRRRSRSATSSIGPCGRDGTAKKQSSSVGSAPASRSEEEAASRRARSAALRRRTPRARRRRPHRRRCLPAPAPTRPPRRCGGSRLRRLHACGERREPGPDPVATTSRSYPRRRRPAIAVRLSSVRRATCSDSERIPGIAFPGRLNPHERSLLPAPSRVLAPARPPARAAPDLVRDDGPQAAGRRVPRTTVRPRCRIT